MRKIIFALLVVVLFLVACGKASTPTTTPETQPNAPTQPASQIATSPQNAQPTVDNADPAVMKLFNRTSSVKSYSFDLAQLPNTPVHGTYMVKGDKAKVTPTLAVKPSKIDVIYLDTTQKTATGYCLPSELCDNPNIPHAQSYDAWGFVPPTDWTNQIKEGKAAGTLMFYDRPVTKVRYEADGKYYEAYVDNYYGYPLRVAIYSDDAMTNLVGGYEYRNFAFNNVKDTDVVHTDFPLQ